MMALAEERAPQGFDDLEAVISHAELLRIADEYKKLTGSDLESVNRELEAANSRQLKQTRHQVAEEK